MHGYTLPLVRVLPGAQVILTAQAFSLLELPLPAAERPMANRIGLLFDVDRDERIVDVLVALSYRDMRARAAVVAIAESKGGRYCVRRRIARPR